MAREIKTAWVDVPSMRIRSKEMTFDEVRAFCKEHNLGVWKNKTVVPIEEYKLGPVLYTGRTYCFDGPCFLTSPSIDLVPFGTKVEYGRYVFPNNSRKAQKQ